MTQGNSVRECALARKKARMATELAETMFRKVVTSVKEAESARKAALALEAAGRACFDDRTSISAREGDERSRALHRGS